MKKTTPAKSPEPGAPALSSSVPAVASAGDASAANVGTSSPADATAVSANAAIIRSVEDALNATGCSNFTDLVDMAKVGLSLMAAIAEVPRDGILKDWKPTEDPASIVAHLLNLLEERSSVTRDIEPEAHEVDAADFSGATHIRISSTVDGFRRAGIAHSREPVDHPLGRFTHKQLEALLAEPNLVAELV